MGMFISGSSTSTGSFHELHIADRVGIGITNPSTALEIDGGIIQNTSNPFTQMIDTSGGGDTYGLNNNSSRFSIYNWTDSREELVFDGSGNVGVGVAAPSQKLEIAGAALINNGTSTHHLYFGNTSYGIHVVHSSGVMNFVSNTSTRFQIKNGGDVNVIGWVEGNGENALFSSTSTGLLLQAPSTTEKIFFRDLNGNVGMTYDAANKRLGIGESSPDEEMHLKGAEPKFRIENSSDSGKYFNMHLASGGGVSKLRFDSETHSNTLLVTNNNRVGIGAGAPAVNLHIESSQTDTDFTNNSVVGGSSIIISNQQSLDNTFSSLQFIAKETGGNDQSAAIVVESTSATTYSPKLHIVQRTASNTQSTRLTIDESGRVGIGVADPDSPLEIYHSTDAQIKLSINTHGDAGIMNGNADGLMIYGKGAANQIRFYSNTTEKMRVDSTGVGIGFVTPTEALHVNGNIKATGTLAISGYSDVGSAITSLSSGGISKSGTPVDNQVAVFTGANQVEGSSNLTFASNVLAVDGDITATGKITAQEFNVQFVSSSILFSTGSNIFGDSTDDTHTFTGNVNISGSSTSSLFTVDGTQGRLF